jgi:hypothetical protein
MVNSEQEVQECDATEDEQRMKGWKQKTNRKSKIVNLK